MRLSDCIAFEKAGGGEQFGVIISMTEEVTNVQLMKRTSVMETDIHPDVLTMTSTNLSIATNSLATAHVILCLFMDFFTSNSVKHLRGARDIYCIVSGPISNQFQTSFSREGLMVPVRLDKITSDRIVTQFTTGVNNSEALRCHLQGRTVFAEEMISKLRRGSTVGSSFRVSINICPEFAAFILRVHSQLPSNLVNIITRRIQDTTRSIGGNFLTSTTNKEVAIRIESTAPLLVIQSITGIDRIS
jgi:hypothetical protein